MFVRDNNIRNMGGGMEQRGGKEKFIRKRRSRRRSRGKRKRKRRRGEGDRIRSIFWKRGRGVIHPDLCYLFIQSHYYLLLCICYIISRQGGTLIIPMHTGPYSGRTHGALGKSGSSDIDFQTGEILGIVTSSFLFSRLEVDPAFILHVNLVPTYLPMYTGT